MSQKNSSDNPLTQKRTVKSYSLRVFKESSVGVVSSVAQTTSTRRKVFKTFTLIVCLTGFLYQSGKYLSFVFQYPTAVDIDVQRPDTYNVPAYTFCDNNRINKKIFCEKFPNRCEIPSEEFCEKYESYCGENKTLKPKKEYYFLHDELTVEEIKGLTVELNAFALTDKYKGEDIIGPYLRLKGQEQIYLCYSLNDRVNNSLLPLTSTPRKIERLPVNTLKFRVTETEVFLPGNRAGILFALHSPFKAVNPFETGIFMRPGRTYLIYVSMDEEILEKSPYDTHCVNYTELWEKNGHSGPRSQDMCRHNCLADLSLRCFGCIVPLFLFPREEKYCGTDIFHRSDNNCPENPEEVIKSCDVFCRDDCTQTRFHFTVQERFKGNYDKEGNIIQDSEDYINVEIYLDGDEVIVYKHTPKYMSVEVFSSIGGFIGIWLGMSLLDIADILEGFFRISWFSFRKT